MADGMDDVARMHIRNAMVLIAGIKMVDADNPCGLWTALEDAYDELSEAIGSDGDVGKDEEEAKARGRCVVVPSNGNNAKMREALELAEDELWSLGAFDVSKRMEAALAAPARPCDTMGWRDAWAKWRTEVKPQKPETYGEAYSGTVAFLDWFTTPMKGEVVEVKRCSE